MSTSSRRMGSKESEMAISMLDAAIEILKEEGYAALTSRRIAEYLGTKQRLLYYYFHSMDEVVLEAFKKLANHDLERLEEAFSSERPIHQIWDIFLYTSDARLITEFMALANRSDGLREEVINFIETSRKIQIKALKKAIPADSKMTPDVLAFMMSSIALSLNREAALGIRQAHSGIKKSIADYFDMLEP